MADAPARNRTTQGVSQLDHQITAGGSEAATFVSLPVGGIKISFPEARENVDAVLDGVVADADVTLISRRHTQVAVVISLDTLEQVGRDALLDHLRRDVPPIDAGS
jgi:antitoxin YefM